MRVILNRLKRNMIMIEKKCKPANNKVRLRAHKLHVRTQTASADRFSKTLLFLRVPQNDFRRDRVSKIHARSDQPNKHQPIYPINNMSI